MAADEQADIDWAKVERLMRDSITGRKQVFDQLWYLEDAWRREPERYAELHQQLKAEEDAVMRGGF